MMSCGAISPSRSRRPAVPWNASEAACSCALSFSRSVFSPITIAPACCRGTSVDAEPRGEHRQAEDEGAGEQREGAVRQARGDLGTTKNPPTTKNAQRLGCPPAGTRPPRRRPARPNKSRLKNARAQARAHARGQPRAPAGFSASRATVTTGTGARLGVLHREGYSQARFPVEVYP